MSIPFLTVGIYQDDAKYREFLQVLESKGFFKGLTKDTPGKCHADMVIDYCLDLVIMSVKKATISCLLD